MHYLDLGAPVSRRRGRIIIAELANTNRHLKPRYVVVHKHQLRRKILRLPGGLVPVKSVAALTSGSISETEWATLCAQAAASLVGPARRAIEACRILGQNASPMTAIEDLQVVGSRVPTWTLRQASETAQPDSTSAMMR
jgi:hypothetical protein